MMNVKMCRCHHEPPWPRPYFFIHPAVETLSPDYSISLKFVSICSSDAYGCLDNTLIIYLHHFLGHAIWWYTTIVNIVSRGLTCRTPCFQHQYFCISVCWPYFRHLGSTYAMTCAIHHCLNRISYYYRLPVSLFPDTPQ